MRERTAYSSTMCSKEDVFEDEVFEDEVFEDGVRLDRLVAAKGGDRLWYWADCR